MPSIFKREHNLEFLRGYGADSLSGHLGIEYVEAGEDYLLARMPVDERTRQPYGILHGGASVALAETLGSVASFLTLAPEDTRVPVGFEINANHLRPARSGWVYGRATPIHLGRRTHVWDIRISDEAGNPVCVSRLSVMLIERG